MGELENFKSQTQREFDRLNITRADLERRKKQFSAIRMQGLKRIKELCEKLNEVEQIISGVVDDLQTVRDQIEEAKNELHRETKFVEGLRGNKSDEMKP